MTLSNPKILKFDLQNDHFGPKIDFSQKCPGSSPKCFCGILAPKWVIINAGPKWNRGGYHVEPPEGTQHCPRQAQPRWHAGAHCVAGDLRERTESDMDPSATSGRRRKRAARPFVAVGDDFPRRGWQLAGCVVRATRPRVGGLAGYSGGNTIPPAYTSSLLIPRTLMFHCRTRVPSFANRTLSTDTPRTGGASS